MPRSARIVFPGAPHHVVQRGNRRQRTFFTDDDYAAYLRLAAEVCDAAGVEVWAYCLMPNHVHLILAPPDEGSLSRVMGDTHRHYTRRINHREAWRGFLWQGRFASYPMDECYLRICARYVGLNPVRAGIASKASDWPWSSVRGHLGLAVDPLLTAEPLATRLGDEIAAFFDVDADAAGRRALREAEVAGRPLGSREWLKARGDMFDLRPR
jgi:putative transposase